MFKEKKKENKNFKAIASRKSSESIISSLVKESNTADWWIADLAGSNNTKTINHKILKPKNFDGNYIHYGVREHAMCGIMNGLALHSK